MADRSAQLPDGWICTSLSNVADVVMGQSPDSLYVNEEQIGIPFLQGNAEFTSKYPVAIHWVTQPRKRSQKNDILISVRAPVGEINIADNDYCIGRGLAAIRFRNNIDDSIGWYLIAHHKGQLQQLAQGSTFTAVSSADISQLELIIPTDKIEQRKIAEILGTVDAAIEQTEALICKQERVKQGLMADLLTRGVDENGEVRATAEERPEAYKTMEFGVIPKKWEVHPMGDYVSSSAFGPRFSSTLYSEDGQFALVRTTDLDKEGNINYSNLPLVASDDLRFQNHILEINDLMISRSGTIGIAAVFEGYTNPTIPGAFLIRFRFKPGLLPQFMRRYFNWGVGRQRIINEAAGGVQQNVTGTALLRLSIPIPLLFEQEKIVSILDSADEEKRIEQQRLEKLLGVKCGLMQDLLSGAVRV